MTYWISAKTTDDGPLEHLLGFVEAESFNEALEELARRCVDKWGLGDLGDRKWRRTSVTEQPEEGSGPVALLVDLTGKFHRRDAEAVRAGWAERAQRGRETLRRHGVEYEGGEL